MTDPKQWQSIEATAVLFFLLQAVRVLFSVLFGLIYDTIFAGRVPLVVTGLAVVVTFLAFLIPAVIPRRHGQGFPRWLAALVFLARVPLTVDHPMVRFVSGLVLIAAAMAYLTLRLRYTPLSVPSWLILALLGDQLVRALGHTYDITLRPGWLPWQGVLSLGLLGLTLLLHRRGPFREIAPQYRVEVGDGLAIGALLFLETALLAFPNALTRWSSGLVSGSQAYGFLAPALFLVTGLPLGRLSRRLMERLVNFLWPMGGVLFIVALLLSLILGRMALGPLSAGALLLAQWLGLLAIPYALADCPVEEKEQTGRALALGGLFFLVLHFAYAFTFTYPYTLPFFRGMGLPILLLAALVTALPTMGGAAFGDVEALRIRHSSIQVLAFVALGLLIAWIARPPRLVPPSPEGRVRAATYNIHYGYDTHWRYRLEAMAQALEENGVEVVFLQEVDAARITSYGVDNALWLGRRLGMQVVYQPTLEQLSGIALLSRWPVEAADGVWLTSALEQTAIVHARLRVGERGLDAYGIWLGLTEEERIRQIEEAVAFIGDAEPALFGGDLNSPPDSPVYRRLEAAGFVDPFRQLGLEPAPTEPSESPEKRIDYVWLRGLFPEEAHVPETVASDHRPVVVEARWP
ncbi:MAG TPA: hypothetical protein ENK56_03390 [Chloroflexi bacterium]|nr:hypothetical protein [Chloroflexota bacterium]